MINFIQYRWLHRATVFLLLLPFASQADPAAELSTFFQHQTLKANFSQQVLDQRGRVQQVMDGRLVIQRPGKFLWLYQSPYEQYIVADGHKVWLYDVDLEQVTVKAQDQTLSGTPAMMLSNPAELQKQFSIGAIERGDGLQWFELTPKGEAGSFERLYIGMQGRLLSRLELQDSFGQLTRLMFEDVVINDDVAADTFVFSVPEGVDVIDETVAQ